MKVTCCTICGSDVHTWSGRRDSPVPIIVGHEIVGIIAAKGDAVTNDSADRPLENVWVQGAGALGIYAAALAKHYGGCRLVV